MIQCYLLYCRLAKSTLQTSAPAVLSLCEWVWVSVDDWYEVSRLNPPGTLSAFDGKASHSVLRTTLGDRIQAELLDVAVVGWQALSLMKTYESAPVETRYVRRIQKKLRGLVSLILRQHYRFCPLDCLNHLEAVCLRIVRRFSVRCLY